MECFAKICVHVDDCPILPMPHSEIKINLTDLICLPILMYPLSEPFKGFAGIGFWSYLNVFLKTLFSFVNVRHLFTELVRQ